MSTLYTDIDPKCCAWLTELVRAGELPPAEVLCRDIKEIKPDEVRHLHQFHAFAGIGGWPLALRLAGYDGPCWTASCPCQRLSSATRGRPAADDLWPFVRPLIEACRPRVLFGEQVAQRAWLDRACDDLEAMGYTVWACVLPAYSVGKDHARERIYFACHTDRDSESTLPVHAEVARMPRHRQQPRGRVRSHGISANMARARLGNAIVPQVAAAFVTAWMQTKEAA